MGPQTLSDLEFDSLPLCVVPQALLCCVINCGGDLAPFSGRRGGTADLGVMAVMGHFQARAGMRGISA